MKNLAAACAVTLLLLGPVAAQQSAKQTQDRPVDHNAAAANTQQPSDAERRFRMMLMQRSMGFGGIFGPMIAPLNKPGQPKKDCGHYTDQAACQAHRNGDGWAADRLQQKRSTPSERAWYGG